MGPVTTRPSRRSGWLLAGVLALAACSPAGAAAPQPMTAPAAATPTTAATPAAASPDAATSAVDYAAWVERQGFGGSSGLHQVLNEVHWMQTRGHEVRPFDVDQTIRLVDHLGTWLDEHPATACWATDHDTIRSALGRIHDALVAVRTARATGDDVPVEVAAAMVSDAEAAYALEAPAGC
jgi:hypothetical protein